MREKLGCPGTTVQTNLKPNDENTPTPWDLGAAGTTTIPVPLLDVSQPSETEPRESEAAEAPLPDRADPVAEHRSSCSKRSSRPLDVERASLIRASAGSSRFGNREKIAQSGLGAQSGARGSSTVLSTQGRSGTEPSAVLLRSLALPSRANEEGPMNTSRSYWDYGHTLASGL